MQSENKMDTKKDGRQTSPAHTQTMKSYQIQSAGPRMHTSSEGVKIPL